MAVKVYLAPTPIGNLEDITVRTLTVLRTVGLIAAEDTRRTAILLRHYGITTPVTSLHEHNEHSKAPLLLDGLVREDKSLAVTTDAGSPGISDPGYLVVRYALERGILVEALPGATALIPALTVSGLPTERFVFEGFLPVKKGRQTRLKSLSDEPRTMIFYEAPHRLLQTLSDFILTFGETRKASASRELTKIHEETIRGTLLEIKTHFENGALKGEFVLIVAGAD